MAVTLRDVVRRSRRTVFFGGAGVSTESGIADFRSASGLFSADGPGYAPEEVLSRTFFETRPEIFYGFYRTSMLYPDARPGRTHLALAALERAGRLAAVITQNIDGLHQAAGTQRVLELHGSVHRNTCMDCRREYGLDAVASAVGVPRCECGGIIKPDVVLYEELLDAAVLAAASQEIASADTLIVGGTSLLVYPAAGLLRLFSGRHLVIINRQPTPFDDAATVIVRDALGDAFATFLDDPLPDRSGRRG